MAIRGRRSAASLPKMDAGWQDWFPWAIPCLSLPNENKVICHSRDRKLACYRPSAFLMLELGVTGFIGAVERVCANCSALPARIEIAGNFLVAFRAAPVWRLRWRRIVNLAENL
jgi:hypothetical protein